MLKNIRKFIDEEMEKNPELVPHGCEYRKLYEGGDETITLYHMITMAKRRDLDGICKLNVINEYCEQCPKSSDS